MDTMFMVAQGLWTALILLIAALAFVTVKWIVQDLIDAIKTRRELEEELKKMEEDDAW